MSCGLFATEGGAFCGPTAVAAVTGVKPERVEELVLAWRAIHKPPTRGCRSKQRPVTTMWSSEMEPILNRLGWRVTRVRHDYTRHAQTFAAWQRGRDREATYILLVTGHFVAVSGRWFADSHHRTPIRLTQAPNRRKRVLWVFQVEPIPQTPTE
jgi:hypothetical protein